MAYDGTWLSPQSLFQRSLIGCVQVFHCRRHYYLPANFDFKLFWNGFPDLFG